MAGGSGVFEGAIAIFVVFMRSRTGFSPCFIDPARRPSSYVPIRSSSLPKFLYVTRLRSPGETDLVGKFGPNVNQLTDSSCR